MSNRKYPKVSGYWVYSIKIPSVNKYYIGVSRRKECYKRWDKSKYVGTAIEPYLDEWDSMIKTVLVDNLTKEEAYKYEDNILRALKMNDLCINKQRSGLFRTNDANAYNREWKKNNPEYRERQKQNTKQYYENNKEQIKQRARQNYQKKKLEQQHTALP